MRSNYLRAAMLGLFAVALIGSQLTAAEPAFGVLRAPATDAVRTQAQDWLKSTGNFNQAAFDAIWKQSDRPVVDLVAETLALGSPEARKLLAEANDPNGPAPLEIPDLIKDTKLPAFLRANLALAYGRALCNRRVYEEALEALKGAKVEQVVDPAAYLFHRAVAEHATLQRADATKSVGRLLDDVPDAPERYKMVAALMYLDMQQWKDKDLGDIGRKMNNIERRLELARGGPETQRQQREVLNRLDELIKKLENQQKQSKPGDGDGKPGDGKQPAPGCPPGGAPGSQPGNQPGQSAGQPTAPQTDSFGGKNSGPGNVDQRKLREMVEAWGKLPEKERARAMTEMIRSMPPAYHQMIEDYFRRAATLPDALPPRRD